MTKTIYDTLKQFQARMNNTTASLALSVVTFCIILIAILVWFLYYAPLAANECSLMHKIYGTLNGKISSIDPSLEQFSYTFKDYYIKTAYNCCSGGNYANDYVSTCVIKNLLKQGVRGLDFEIYSIDDQPVVATSTTNDYHVKETFNSIPFASIMDILANYAFAGSTAPNPNDPIIIHLRIKSTNKAMYDNFANIFGEYDNILLGKDYSYENHGKNLGNSNLKSLMGKIVVIVDKSNPAFMESDKFYEYVNMTSNSVFMRALHFYDIKYTPDVPELIESNKYGMTLAMPDKGSNPPNPDPIVLRETGCQFLGMRYQLIDVNSESADIFFDESGHAFVLKPERLRYIPVELPDPVQQTPELSYATRTVASDFYKFEI